MRKFFKDSVSKVYSPIKYHIYKFYVKCKIPFIRRKDKIKVLFIVSEVSTWKSEQLYRTMFNHPRFNPIIGISTCRIPPNSKAFLVQFLQTKGYFFIDLDSQKNSINEIAPDIIFYYKPYSLCYSPGHYFNKNLRYVFCGIDYCFEITNHAVHMQKDLFDYCWQYYAENDDVANRKKELLGAKANNIRVTGVPIQDLLTQPKSFFQDPWKDKTGKKRIIYAPHHSIKGTNGDGIEFATFLDFGETILEFAKKYNEQITIAFKPHPNLYMKLIDIWGEERTNNYYSDWESLFNTQIETGDYIGLFKHSDAIIHDCSSFLIEYLFMNNPSMFLFAETNHQEDLLNYAREGLACYEVGHQVHDIECFINRVITGEDRKHDIRNKFYDKYLVPPMGKTACENIITSILEY